MILALLAAAQAQPAPVDAVECRRDVHFASPYRWSWSAEHTPITGGTALLVVADPGRLAPRDIGQSVIYVEGWPAEILWQSGDRAWILAPLELSAEARVWFGPPTLPERVDAAARASAADEARALPPIAAKASGRPVEAGSRRALIAALGVDCGE